MSVCTSANPFNSRPVTTAARRPALANDERWVAMSKNIFQDILNAILIQTTFSSASVGKRYLSARQEVSLHSSSATPQSFTTGEVPAKQNPISGFKEDEDVKRPTFDSTVIFAKNEAPDESSDSGTLYEAPALEGGRPAEEKEVFFWRGNGRHTAPPEVKEQPPAVFGKPSACGELDHERSKLGNEVVCLSRRRDDASSAFSKVGAYDQSSAACRENSHLSVYCEEAYVGKVPMMIIGLRPYHPSDAKLSCLIQPTNQMSLHSNVLKKCPMEISVKTTTAATTGLDPLNSRKAESSLLADGRRDQYDRCAKITDKFLSPPPTDQRRVNTAGGGTSKNGQKLVKSMDYHQHHSENAPEQNNGKSSMKLSPSEVQGNGEAAAASRLTSNKASTNEMGRKSSRDHSILTILGRLSPTEDDEDRKKAGAKSPGAAGASETRGLDKSRLLGIGVTVIGRSRWMAVDKCIVYDMIDQVLKSGERDYFTTDDTLYSPASRCDVSRPQLEMDRRGVSDGLVRKRSHHLPRTQRNGSTALAPCGITNSDEAKKKIECSFEGDLKQNHDMDLPSSSSSSSFVNLSSTQEILISSKSASGENSIMRRNCESPAAKDRLSNCKSLEGVSVLRSLLSDDPIDACHDSSVTEVMAPHPHPTSIAGGLTEDAKAAPHANTGRAKAADCSKMPIDELRRVKRSRHNLVADGKKRRVNSGHPSTTHDDDTISSSRRCSIPSFAASATTDRVSKSSHSMKWKSSMLMRMRTEEAIENEADT